MRQKHSGRVVVEKPELEICEWVLEPVERADARQDEEVVGGESRAEHGQIGCDREDGDASISSTVWTWRAFARQAS
jgi:hypothetical protein